MIEKALNVGISTLATEHLFTTFLSSPKASEKFLDPKEVREMFLYATIVSLGFSTVMSLILKNVWGVVSSLVLIGIFYIAYRKAMGS